MRWRLWIVSIMSLFYAVICQIEFFISPVGAPLIVKWYFLEHLLELWLHPQGWRREGDSGWITGKAELAKARCAMSCILDQIERENEKRASALSPTQIYTHYLPPCSYLTDPRSTDTRITPLTKCSALRNALTQPILSQPTSENTNHPLGEVQPARRRCYNMYLGVVALSFTFHV